jgi:hypothetical protein
MKHTVNAIAGFVFFCAVVTPAASQQRDTLFATPFFGFVEAQTDTVLKETRTGERLIEAEIDFCFQLEPEGPWDRAVVPLKVDGVSLSGTGATQLTKAPISFDLTRTPHDRLYEYSGTIRLAGKTVSVSSRTSADREGGPYDRQSYIALNENPESFHTVSPQAVTVRFSPGALNNVLAALRGEPVVLQPHNGLVQDCNVLRTGRQTLELTLAPEKAAALLQKLRKVPGVLAAGWGGYSLIDYAALLRIADWTAGGKLDRERLATALGKSVAQSVSAKLTASRWEAETGELVLTLTRPSRRYREAGFTEIVTARLLAEPERLEAAENFLVWVIAMTVIVADERAGPRLTIAPFHEIGGEGVYIEQTPVAAAIAKDLGGKTWDSIHEKWN